MIFYSYNSTPQYSALFIKDHFDMGLEEFPSPLSKKTSRLERQKACLNALFHGKIAKFSL